MCNYQYFNVDMWNKSNEYNSPQNQVKLLLAAGINPAAYFSGSSGFAVGGTSPVSSSGLPAGSMPGIGTKIFSFGKILNQRTNIH